MFKYLLPKNEDCYERFGQFSLVSRGKNSFLLMPATLERK